MANDVNFRQQFEYWDDVTDEARQNSRRNRDYRDHKQWTDEEVAALQDRGQAPIVINRIAPKVDYLIGIERKTRQDPKAWPRTPEHQDGANAATDALRYVAENAEFDCVSSDTFEDLCVEGVEGAIVEWEEEQISITRIPFDRIYYDPHSLHRFFEDATYKGLFIWMDKDRAIQMFGEGKEREIENAFTESVGFDEGTEDKPMWVDKKRKRIRVCQHYYLKDNVWHVVYFSGDVELIPPQVSPYQDENGEPDCPLELAYAYQDRDANKYGWVQQFIDIQDEINHRRSKALYMLSRRQVIADRGAVDDIDEARYQLTRGDGVVQVTPGMRFDVDPGIDLAQGQAQLLAEAKQEIDQIAARTELAGDSSGRSRMFASNNDLIEVGPLFDTHRIFKKRLYRQIWNRVRQFWDSERWVRVTDDEENLKFVGLNQPMTVAQVLQERAQEGDQMAAETLKRAMQAQDPRLNQVAEIKNNVVELDIDITIGETMDASNIQQEQLEMLINLAQAYGPQFVPFDAVVEMTQLRNKREILDRLKGDPQKAAMNEAIQMQQLQMQIAKMQSEIEKMQAETQNKQADTQHKLSETDKTEQETVKTALEAEQTAVETQVIARQPSDRVSVST